MFKEFFLIWIDSPVGIVITKLLAFFFSLTIGNWLLMLFIKWWWPEKYNRAVINLVRNSMGLPDLWEPPKK